MKVKVNTIMYGQFSLATGRSSLLAYTATRVPDLFLYRKFLRFMALRVQLVILASAFVAGPLVSFFFAPRCSTCLAICKSGGTPRALWFRTHCLGHGPSVMRRKSLSLVQGQRKLWYGVWCLPPFPAICKNGSMCPVPYGVGAY